MRLLRLFVLLSLLQSCSPNEGVTTDISKGIFVCNFEELYFWNESGAVVKGRGRESNYCLKVDSDHEYTPAFKVKLGDMGLKKPKQIKVNGWFMASDMNASAKLVACVDNNGNILSWNATETKQITRKSGVWTMIEAITEIPANVVMDAKVVVYGLRTGSGEVLFDDLEIRITE